jgi:hypothetical protein
MAAIKNDAKDERRRNDIDMSASSTDLSSLLVPQCLLVAQRGNSYAQLAKLRPTDKDSCKSCE